MVALVEGSTWTRPPTGQAGLWSEGVSGAIYYDGGDVGIGDSTPSTILNIKDLTSHTELRIDSPSGNFDSALTFYNQNIKEYDICMDDSATDELKFIRGSNTICSGKDTFTITQSGLEMGVAVFYYDAPIRWYREGVPSGIQSAVGNNFFELDDPTAGGLADIEGVSGGQQGQVLYQP